MSVTSQGIPPEYKTEIITNGLQFLRSITECYGSEKGMELWDQIASVLDQNVKGEMFFAMITNGGFPDHIMLRGLHRNTHPIACIKAIREWSGLGLKDAKDVYDNLNLARNGSIKLHVNPMNHAQAIRDLETHGFIL
jgi:hypothetical protein